MKSRLSELLRSLERQSPEIHVVGDLILDEYLLGYPERLSREAPVAVLEYKESQYRLGGAANAAANAAALGARVTLSGYLGNDAAAERIAELCQAQGIELLALRESSMTSTLKTRVLATNQARGQSHQGSSATQQLLRIDRVHRDRITAEQSCSLRQLVQDRAGQEGMTLLSDYGLGVLSDELVREILADRASKVVVDPCGDFGRFAGAMLLTPNQPDAEAELAMSCDYGDPSALVALQARFLERLGKESSILLTRGGEGMILLNDREIWRVPAYNRAEVFDVTGAGDTVSACVTVALAMGAEMPLAMALGNLAASLVVRKMGAATASLTELANSLDTLAEDLGCELGDR